MNILEQAIQQYAQAYYDGEPLISDIEFDSLVLQLKSEYPNSKLLETGWGYEPKSDHLKKYPHSFHAGSLSKLHVDKIIQGKEKFSDTNGLYATSKLDGASAVAYYESGKLVRVLSRGNGIEGLDITENIKHALPNTISETWITAIRGEIVVTWEDCKKVGGSHPRNVATGLSQSKNKTPEELSILHFVPYYIHEFIGSKDSEINHLANIGFEKIHLENFDKFQLFITSLDICLEILKETFSRLYPIDGIVLTNGTGSSIAVKFEDESMETIVTEIHWEISRTGRMVPVLEVETVNLRGANISRVTANNVTWLKEQGCGIGATIEIVRANEVIPKVVNVLEKAFIDIPIECPECGSILEEYNRDLICPNDNCRCRTKQIIFNIFDSVGVDGIGPSIIESVIDDYNISSINDLKNFIMKVHPEELIDLLGPAKGELFLSLIKKLVCEPISMEQLILNCNIQNVGESAVKSIVKKYNTFTAWGNIFNETKLDESVFPTYLAKDNFYKKLNVIEELFSFYNMYLLVDIKFPDVSTKKQINITLTGSLSKPRKEILKDFNQYADVQEVSIGSAEYLVTNDTDLTSSKGKAALKKGIKILNEEQFINLLKSG